MPPRSYSSGVSNVTNTASTTLWQLVGSTTCRWALYDLLISAAGAAPADNAVDLQFKRLTGAGTVTAFTPVALDNGDPATSMTTGTTGCGNTATIEPTYTASSQLLSFGVNMRATFRSTGLAA